MRSLTDCLITSAGPGSVLTEIIFEDDGIVKIYHLRRQATETKVGKRGEILG